MGTLGAVTVATDLTSQSQEGRDPGGKGPRALPPGSIRGAADDFVSPGSAAGHTDAMLHPDPDAQFD